MVGDPVKAAPTKPPPLSKPSQLSRSVSNQNGSVQRLRAELKPGRRIDFLSKAHGTCVPDDEDESNLYDDFDVKDVSQEELLFWSQLAPAGQKLTDVDSTPVELLPTANQGQGSLSLPMVI